MKLLFDENLSRRLVVRTAALFPGSRHVEDVGLAGRTDETIWAFARDGDYVIVSKDSDFRELCAARGAPPKVVWLRIGNSGTGAIQRLLEQNRVALEAFEADHEEAFLVLALEDGE